MGTFLRPLRRRESNLDFLRLQSAAEQFKAELDQRRTYPSLNPYTKVVDRVTGGDDRGVDNDSQSIRIAPEWEVAGNAGYLRLLVGDMGIATALEVPHLDVLNNSVGAARFAAQVSFDDTFLGSGFGPWHVGVANELATCWRVAAVRSVVTPTSGPMQRHAIANRPTTLAATGQRAIGL